jgi:spore germination cell wall hydrolase CwlJ-like protein
MIGDLAMRLLQAVVAAQVSSASLPPEEIKDVTCLAQNIWFEARGSSAEDQLAVAHVVMNRVASRHYPDDVCEVIWQPKQFSWTHDGRSDRVRFANAQDRLIWKELVQISMAALEGEMPDPTGGATHYHADYVTPAWSSRMRQLIQIDDHIYYRPHGRKVATAS